MYLHNIFIANAFRKGRRVAYDLVIKQSETEKEFDVNNKIQNLLFNIYEDVGQDAVITTHTILTNSEKWNSVVAKDSFFQDMLVVQTVEQFKQYLRENKVLSKNDVKMFIYIVLNHNRDVLINRDKLLLDIAEEYEKTYQKDLYFKDTTYDLSKPIPSEKDLMKYSSIIVDRILSSQDGFKKFKFILNEVYKRIGKSVIA